MFRISAAVVAVLGLAVWLSAGQPGEKAKGTSFTSEGFTLVWGKLKAADDMDFGNKSRSRHTLELAGALEVPDKLDVSAVHKRFIIRSLATDKDEMTPNTQQGLTSNSYNAIHSGVGQVELFKTELPVYSTQIKKLVLDTDVIIAKNRDQFKTPAIVMEDFKNIGHGISIRITSLQMSASRELTVKLDYTRPAKGIGGPFIEQIFALDPDGKELGGGRWTEGDPLGVRGYWIAKFKLSGNQVHQSFRVVIVTEYSTRKLSFDVKGIFAGE